MVGEMHKLVLCRAKSGWVWLYFINSLCMLPVNAEQSGKGNNELELMGCPGSELVL